MIKQNYIWYIYIFLYRASTVYIYVQGVPRTRTVTQEISPP